MTPILNRRLFQPGMLFPGRILADPGRMGRCLFEPRRMRLGNDQHRQTQSVHHTQGVLEIDALAVQYDSAVEDGKMFRDSAALPDRDEEMERQLAEWNQKADQTKAELADRVNTNLKIQGKLNKAGLGEHYVAYRLHMIYARCPEQPAKHM